jgi:hypothetical protein
MARKCASAGGYYPVKYDPVATERAETMEEAEAAKVRAPGRLHGCHDAPLASRRPERAGGRGDRSCTPCRASIAVSTTSSTTCAWHEWLIQSNRLMRDEKSFSRS